MSSVIRKRVELDIEISSCSKKLKVANGIPDAIREGQQALEKLPIAKDSINGADLAYRLAVIYARVGETRRAFESLEQVSRIPFGATYGSLKLDETWDSLRGDPRFEKTCRLARAQRFKIECLGYRTAAVSPA